MVNSGVAAVAGSQRKGGSASGCKGKGDLNEVHVEVRMSSKVY